MSRFGKCQNISGCLLAYRGDEVEVAKDQPFICAECGKPLVEVRSPAKMWMRYVYALLAVAVMAGIAFAASPKLRGLIVKHKPHPGETAEAGSTTTPPEPSPEEKPMASASTTVARTPSETPSAQTSIVPLTTTPEPRPTAPPPRPAEPPPRPAETAAATPDASASEAPRSITSPKRLDLDVKSGENKTVKTEVLTRIDLMPNISATDKDKLYNAVERARSMGKLLTIPFASGRSDFSSADTGLLKEELDRPEIAKLRSDPTCVFVILGYADPKGDPKKNIAISQARADGVLKAMREKCGIINVMHPVAMGGSKLLDAQNLEKNRIVEVWAVLP